MVICALFAPQIAPNDPDNQDLLNMLLPPMWYAGRQCRNIRSAPTASGAASCRR